MAQVNFLRNVITVFQYLSGLARVMGGRGIDLIKLQGEQLLMLFATILLFNQS